MTSRWTEAPTDRRAGVQIGGRAHRRTGKWKIVDYMRACMHATGSGKMTKNSSNQKMTKLAMATTITTEKGVLKAGDYLYSQRSDGQDLCDQEDLFTFLQSEDI